MFKVKSRWYVTSMEKKEELMSYWVIEAKGGKGDY